ncbi:MAG: PAS domain S-box protein [Pirellulaceae bacterium]
MDNDNGGKQFVPGLSVGEPQAKDESTRTDWHQRYVDLYDRAPVGYCSIDHVGRITHFNTTFARIVESEHSTLIGKSLSKIVVPEDQNKLAEFLSLVTHSNRTSLAPPEAASHSCEVRFQTAGQIGRWAQLMTKYVRASSDDNEPNSFVRLVVNDITARKLMELNLKTSEQHLREAQSIAKLGSFHWDYGSEHVFWSDETYRIFGRDPNTFTPSLQSYLELIHPDDQQRIQQRIQEVMERQGSFDHEYRVTLPDGSERWLHARGRTVSGPHGDGTRLSGTCQDITLRKASQAKLQQSERLLQIVTGTARVGLVVIDRSHRYVYANATFASILRLPESDFTGTRVADLPHSLYERQVKVWLDRGFCGEQVDEELSVTTSTQVLHFALNCEPIWEGGRVEHVVAVLMDITEQRNTEEQLRQAQKMEAVGQLAGGVAHDFNNLLTVIRGYTDLMQSHCHPADPNAEWLEEISTAVERASDLTKSLLAYSRRQMRTLEAVNLNRSIEESLKLLQRSVGDGVEISLALAPDLDSVWADRSEVAQVLLNLSNNARDAMHGQGSFEIATSHVRFMEATIVGTKKLPAGNYIHLMVADSGCGMSEDIRRRVFEPFFTTKDVGQGTGLGLSMVHGIVDSSGSHRCCYSRRSRNLLSHLFAATTAINLSCRSWPQATFDRNGPRDNSVGGRQCGRPAPSGLGSSATRVYGIGSEFRARGRTALFASVTVS